MTDFTLSTQQINQFNDDGFIVVEQLIDNDTIDSIRNAFDRLFSGRFETGIRPDEVNWQVESGDPALTRQICNGWKADKAIAQVILRKDIGSCIATLANWRGVRVMIDNVIWKPPTAKALGYHQDNAFLEWFTPSELVSCWIALDDTSASGGTVEFVRGSHKWRQGKPEGQFHGPEDYRKYMYKAAEREGVEPEIVHVEVPKGGGSFHHGWTWHGSGLNTSSKSRRSLVLHGMHCDVEYVPEKLSEGIGPIYGRYKKIGNNSIDENYFPIIYRGDGYRTPGIESLIN